MPRLLLLLAVVLAFPAGAHAVTLPDVEDEVMCISCGTVLNVSGAPSADRQRDFIRRRIAEGLDKQEIKDAMVAEYGREVLATPPTTGRDAASWAVPVGLALLALLALGLTARRWRRAGEVHAAPATELPEEDAKRLERDMAGYDL